MNKPIYTPLVEMREEAGPDRVTHSKGRRAMGESDEDFIRREYKELRGSGFRHEDAVRYLDREFGISREQVEAALATGQGRGRSGKGSAYDAGYQHGLQKNTRGVDQWSREADRSGRDQWEYDDGYRDGEAEAERQGRGRGRSGRGADELRSQIAKWEQWLADKSWQKTHENENVRNQYEDREQMVEALKEDLARAESRGEGRGRSGRGQSSYGDGLDDGEANRPSDAHMYPDGAERQDYERGYEDGKWQSKNLAQGRGRSRLSF